MTRKKWQKFYIPPEDSHPREGISVEYNTKDMQITIGGWYDTMVGLESETIPLGEFLHRLNITADDVVNALVKYELEHHS